MAFVPIAIRSISRSSEKVAEMVLFIEENRVMDFSDDPSMASPYLKFPLPVPVFFQALDRR
jgi:hypothetical protein